MFTRLFTTKYLSIIYLFGLTNQSTDRPTEPILIPPPLMHWYTSTIALPGHPKYLLK